MCSITIPRWEDVVVVEHSSTGMTHYAPKIKGQPCNPFYSKNFYKRTLCGMLKGLHAMNVLKVVDRNDASCRRCKAVLKSNEQNSYVMNQVISKIQLGSNVANLNTAPSTAKMSKRVC